ncbi:response regulator transcription factor [Mammaliicoccus stepanovicii]|uniref:Response regulator SaeR n=1 Tax=Mammaliicoccus stepanovicii TaxID=643214 RepID=A0A240A595_9STAP|nr:response regulator transcription factor [Mammaliicoccus stepanovicii]PNZ79147.1 DNA-binding response regulator [Mammaliicoccus stepanovicii]GGI39541.1 response regulator SaeR [Mammaliicoccus stepanovicii]SNV78477.1 Response regulator SaeR [Mammaliicoccus stepanovicii]
MAHILIADDEQDILDICKTYFEYEGHRVVTASNGQEALNKLDTSIDLIILDIMMPEMNGYEVVQVMKDKHYDIPFIYLTAKTQENDTLYALTLGADDYIKKPFSPRELVLRSHNLLNRTKKYSNQEVLTFSSLTLCKQEKSLMINGQNVPLRVKEFDVLWYLAEHEKVVISKSELLEKVWGYDYYEDANTVNVHIRRIREKLEQHEYYDYAITTVWGLGYKFERAK